MQNHTETIGKYISILYRSGASYFNRCFESYNIGSGQYPFLIVLAQGEGATQEELSCRLDIDKGTTAKALKKLEQEGYITRVVDSNDKRAHRVYLTEDGKKIIGDIYNILYSWNDILTSDFTEEERETALKLLQRMFQNKIKNLKGECK